MALLQVNVPDHEVAFVEKQLALLGYPVQGSTHKPLSAAEKLASPAQKTMLKAFDELKAAYLANNQWASSEQLVDEALALRDKMWGPGL
jgi:hypothetical protein